LPGESKIPAVAARLTPNLFKNCLRVPGMAETPEGFEEKTTRLRVVNDKKPFCKKF
jgi:hypothetical protein